MQACLRLGTTLLKQFIMIVLEMHLKETLTNRLIWREPSSAQNSNLTPTILLFSFCHWLKHYKNVEVICAIITIPTARSNSTSYSRCFEKSSHFLHVVGWHTKPKNLWERHALTLVTAHSAISRSTATAATMRSTAILTGIVLTDKWPVWQPRYQWGHSICWSLYTTISTCIFFPSSEVLDESVNHITKYSNNSEAIDLIVS